MNYFRLPILICFLLLGCSSLPERFGYPIPFPVGPNHDLEFRYRGDGPTAFDGRFESSTGFSEGLAAVEFKDHGYRFLNVQGGIAFPGNFEDARPFEEDLAAVKFAGKWGYIRMSGAWQISPKYIWAQPFHEGVAPVLSDQGLEIINRDGKKLGEGPYSSAGGASEGLIDVGSKGHYGFIDTHGTLVIPLTFDKVYGFGEGLAPVLVRDHWGYINHSRDEDSFPVRRCRTVFERSSTCQIERSLGLY